MGFDMRDLYTSLGIKIKWPAKVGLGALKLVPITLDG